MTWTCHLANQRGALSHAQRAGSVYKVAVWSTRNSVLDALLSYGYNGITIDSKISTDRPGSDPAGRPLIHLRNQHDPTGRKPSTAGRPEWPDRLAAEAIPVFRQFELVTRLGQSSTSNYWCGGGIHPLINPPIPDLRFPWFSSVPSVDAAIEYFKLGHNWFSPHSSQFINHLQQAKLMVVSLNKPWTQK
jgi:hypothetical protein